MYFNYCDTIINYQRDITITLVSRWKMISLKLNYNVSLWNNDMLFSVIVGIQNFVSQLYNKPIIDSFDFAHFKLLIFVFIKEKV